MKKSLFANTLVLFVWLGFAASIALAEEFPRKMFGKGNPFRAEELPPGKLKTNLQALDPQAKEKAMKWLHTFDFDQSDAAKHLRVDNGGGIFIVCPDDHGDCEGHSHGPATPETKHDSSSATGNTVEEPEQSTEPPPIEYASVAVNSPPAYHSRPGATRRIFWTSTAGSCRGPRGTPARVSPVGV